MPNLNELIVGGLNSTIFTTNNIVIEPLDGPTSVEDVMDRFPEEVYQQGRDSHIYRLLSALCGDAGAGLAKKQAYAARLRFEAEFINFRVLDKIYVAQFTFQRLRKETYPFDTDVEGLTPAEWDQVVLADQSYYHRMQEWWTATRYGNSPEGVRLAAQAGMGVECDIVEHYRYVFDQYSDLPLGLKPDGIGISTGEFIIVPRVLLEEEVAYPTEREKSWVFSPPILATTTRPVPYPDPGDEFAVEKTYYPDRAARIRSVGNTSTIGKSLILPEHQPGDLIILTASRMWTEPVAPSAGGTVPTWTKQTTGSTGGLFLSTYTTVANASNHTSGNFSGTDVMAMVASVYRPENGTASVGTVGSPGIVRPTADMQPVVQYPGQEMSNLDGTSTSYLAAAVSTPTTTYIDLPPKEYSAIASVDGDGLVPAVGVYEQQSVLESPETQEIRVSSHEISAGITNSMEIRLAPDPGIVIETPQERDERVISDEGTTTNNKEPLWRLLPEIERNANEMLDRLRPASTVASFKTEPTRYSEIPIATQPVASSERLNVHRLITGRTDVNWPAVDRKRNYFIVKGVEKEASYYFGMNRDLPVVFHTVENVHAYVDNATTNTTYGTDEFFEEVDGISPFETFKSEQAGNYFPVIRALFPFVAQTSSDTIFDAWQAIANQNTILIMEGQTVV